MTQRCARPAILHTTSGRCNGALILPPRVHTKAQGLRVLLRESMGNKREIQDFCYATFCYARLFFTAAAVPNVTNKNHLPHDVPCNSDVGGPLGLDGRATAMNLFIAFSFSSYNSRSAGGIEDSSMDAYRIWRVAPPHEPFDTRRC